MPTRHAKPPPKFQKGREEEMARSLSQHIRELQEGFGRSCYDVTLKAGTTETVYPLSIVDAERVASIATTQVGAAAIVAGAYVACEEGQVRVTHDAGGEDRIVCILLVG